MRILSAWFWIWHVHWSVKSSNLFRGLNFREVSWWQDADAAGLNAADVELLDKVSSNRFGLGEPLGKSVRWSLETWWRSVQKFTWKYLQTKISRYKHMSKKYLNWIYEYEWDSILCKKNTLKQIPSTWIANTCYSFWSLIPFLILRVKLQILLVKVVRRQECRCQCCCYCCRQCCCYCCWFTAIGRSARNCAWKRDLPGALAYEESTALFATGTNLADYHLWGRLVCISKGTCEEVATLFTASCFSGNASGWSISLDVAKLACNKLTALLAQFGSGKTTSFIEFRHATRPSEPHNTSCSGLFLKEAFRARPPKMELQPCEIPRVLCWVIRCCVIWSCVICGWVVESSSSFCIFFFSVMAWFSPQLGNPSTKLLLTLWHHP